MALSDSLNQAAWAFISDWMNKRNAQYSMENMLKQQEGWSKYQEEGADLETRRQVDQLQAQKEAAAFAKMLGMGDQDDPSALRVLELVKSLIPEAVPKGVEGLVPGMQSGSALLNEVIPKLLTGETEGVDYSGASRAGGGIQNVIRMIETGMGRKSLQEQLPGQRLNAIANYFGSQNKGQVSESQSAGRVFTVIGQTKADLDTIMRKFLPQGAANSTYDQLLGFAMSLMPMSESKEPAAKQEDARQWINKVGVEFFDDLSGLVNSIYMRAAKGEVSDAELMIINDAASPYAMAEKYAEEKKRILDGLQNLPKYKSLNVQELFKNDLTFKQRIKADIWNSMYGGQ